MCLPSLEDTQTMGVNVAAPEILAAKKLTLTEIYDLLKTKEYIDLTQTQRRLRVPRPRLCYSAVTAHFSGDSHLKSDCHLVVT